MLTQNTGVYCEPCCIKKGYDIEIHHVTYGENDHYQCEMHFHEVHELIFFEKIEGSFFYHKGEAQLQDGDIVFTPEMETHDFDLTNKEKSWYIVQFPRTLFQQEGFHDLSDLFEVGMHLRVAPEFRTQLMQIVKWVHQSFNGDKHNPKSMALLNLALVMLKVHGNVSNVNVPRMLSAIPHKDKLQPVMNLFSSENSVDLNLEQAAKQCHMSPSYFSRVFKSVFRFSYSEYVLRHRLYHAARLLGQSELSITRLSYDLNFSNPSHFIAQFKKQYGCTPNRYRKAIISKALRI